MEYICSKCGKGFDRKDNLDRHLKKKNPCDVVKNEGKYKCINCERRFKFRNNLTIHIKNNCQDIDTYECDICGKQFQTKYHYDKHITEICLKNYQLLQEKNKELEETIKVLTEQITANQHTNLSDNIQNNIVNSNNTTNNTTNNITNNTNNITNNTINININEFGKEKISNFLINKFLEIIKDEPQLIIPKFFKVMHIDSEENRNIYMPNNKNTKIYIFSNNKWQEREKSTIFKELCDQKFSQVTDLMHKHKKLIVPVGKYYYDLLEILYEYQDKKYIKKNYISTMKKFLFDEREILKKNFIKDK